MSLLISLLSAFLVVFVGLLLLAMTRRVHDWSHRRTLYLAVLLLPLIMVIDLCTARLSGNGLTAEYLVLFGIGGGAIGACGLGVFRLLLMRRFVAQHALFLDDTLQQQADDLVQHLNGPSARVRVTPITRPLALTFGLRRPTIVLSTWMLDHLDQREVEAVLAHELEHVARRDYLVGWLATLLRDAFFYLPTSHIAYRHLQQEKELACDDSTVCVTHRPLALASALTKVWLHAIDQPELATVDAAQSLANGEQAMHGRIERLLASPQPAHRHLFTRSVVLSLNLALMLPLGIFQVLCLLLLALSTWSGCHPLAVVGSLC